MPRKDVNAGASVLKRAAGLDQARNRQRYHQQRVEGVQAVRELLIYAPELVRDILTTPDVLTAHEDIAHLIQQADHYVHVGEASVIAKAAPSAQGICAVANQAPRQSRLPEKGQREDSGEGVRVSERSSSAGSSDLLNIVENSSLLVCCVQANDPGNVGTIIRTADAAGVGAVILGKGSVDPTSPKVIRSAAGSTFHLPVVESDVKDVVMATRSAGFQVLLADADGCDIRSPQINLRKKTLWLVGNEAHGFASEQKAWADEIVSLPMWGRAESLNLAVATGVCIYMSAMAQSELSFSL